MKSILTSFRVRRAARQPGQADTLLALEWLGGEALVAPLPMIGDAQPTQRARLTPVRSDTGDSDWRAI